MAEEKVLLVDDDKDFIDILSQRMKHRGITVDTASSGAEALEKQATAEYDAIILDMLMPNMDGLEALKQLLSKNPELRVILLTGHASVQQGIQAMKLGAVDFLEKPADIDKLTERIRAAKAEKMLLVEKRLENKIKRILKERPW